MYGNGMFPPGSKHKETESLHHPAKRPPPPPVARKGTEMTSSSKQQQQLLAGYMAHEFRTSGTVLGHKLDGAGAETAGTRTPDNGNERYREITSLIMMKSDGGAQIPGIVNPAQLARWIRM